MSIDDRYTPDPADVALVVGALPVDPADGTIVIGYGPGEPSYPSATAEPDVPLWGSPEPIAERILRALAAEGRLLPADAETRTEWGFARWEGDLVWQTTEYAARIAAAEHPPAVAMSRSVWVGPWLPVPTDTDKITEE